MSRILANIILILIIAFTVSAVPINTEILNLNITLPEPTSEEPEEGESSQIVEEPSLGLTYQNVEFDYLYNPPQTIELKFVGSSSLENEEVKSFVEDIQLEIFRGNPDLNQTIIKRLPSSDMTSLTDITINGDVATLTVDISNIGLHLANGHYSLEFHQKS